MRLPLESLPLVVASIGKVATRAELRLAGVSGPLLTKAVRSGLLLRPRRGHYALPTIDEECATAIALGGRLGSLSAARSYGWWDGANRDIHVSWPDHGNVAKPGRVRFAFPESRIAAHRRIVPHWRIIREPLDGTRECWRESPEQTLAQVLLSSDRLTAIACADSAIRCGTLGAVEVAAVLSAMPRRVRRWSRFIDGRPDSGLESIVRVWLMDRDIPFRLHPLLDGIGEVDFLIGTSLIIETDGRAFHSGAAALTRDYRRDAAAAARGYIVLRLDYALVLFDWAACERSVLEHVERGDHLRRID